MKRLISALLLGTVALHADVPIIDRQVTVDVPVSSWSELRNKEVVKQRYDFSCGAASLSTILKYFYQIDASEKVIVNTVLASKGVTAEAKQLTASDFALSFADLATYSQSRGFKGVGVAMDLEGLRKLRVPVIIYVKIRKFEHFSVFKGIHDDFVYLADPSFGNMKVKVAKFKEMFYQRDDLQHPGKVLAIIPLDKASVKPSKTFMKTESDSKYLYNLIERRMIHH